MKILICVFFWVGSSENICYFLMAMSARAQEPLPSELLSLPCSLVLTQSKYVCLHCLLHSFKWHLSCYLPSGFCFRLPSACSQPWSTFLSGSLIHVFETIGSLPSYALDSPDLLLECIDIRAHSEAQLGSRDSYVIKPPLVFLMCT